MDVVKHLHRRYRYLNMADDIDQSIALARLEGLDDDEIVRSLEATLKREKRIAARRRDLLDIHGHETQNDDLLEGLSRTEREVIEWNIFQGVTQTEIAERLNCRQQFVSIILSVAKEKLRTRFS